MKETKKVADIKQYFNEQVREVQVNSLNKAVHIKSSYARDTIPKLRNVAMAIFNEIGE